MRKTIQKTILENGLTVISEHIPTVRSVSAGLWVKAGSRHEHAHENGIAHFLEHMVFKGTQKRTALQIAQSLEKLGGSLNAYTSKEHTLFFTHTLDSHLGVSINILADIVCNPLLLQSDLENERQVVLEEIDSVKDTPEEYIYDVFQEKLFEGQALGRPILGSADTVGRFNSRVLRGFWQKYYCPSNMILSAAGNVKHERLLKHARNLFVFPLACKTFEAHVEKPRSVQKLDVRIREPFNQTHICIGAEALPYQADERYEMLALNMYLGEGMSSRLFQLIREKYGLAYTVYSHLDFMKDTGIISFYMATNRSGQDQAVELLLAEVHKLSQKPIPKTMVNSLIEQLKGALLLGLESTYNRMARLARNEIYFADQIHLDETVKRIEAINGDRLQQVAKNILKVDQFNIVRFDTHA